MNSGYALLKAGGLRCTGKRLAILDSLAGASHPMDVEEIHKSLMNGGIHLSLSTVYRALEDMEAAGIVSRMSFGESGRRFFELNSISHRHYLRCLGCNKLLPLDSCPISNYQNKLEKETGYSILGHRLDIYGYCPKCRKEADGI